MSRPDPHALAVATASAERLADPHAVRTADSEEGSGHRWPQSLAGGAAGVALLHIERARFGHGNWPTAHAWLAAAARDELSAGPKRWPVLRRADLGAYHLRRHPDHDITRAALSYLVRLTKPLLGRSDDLPGWWIEVAPNGDPSPDFPGGHGNFGMAHGISASLALLSLALLRGVVVDGHTEAIGQICTWLDTWQQQHPAGPWWPGIITLNDIRNRHLRQTTPGRPSWCYGIPGLARAQQLAALATGDTARQRTAQTAMLGCLRDPTQLDRITDSGLCHGMAGVFQSVWRMAADAHTPDLAAELPRLAARLLT